jgi:hypothetical protein
MSALAEGEFQNYEESARSYVKEKHIEVGEVRQSGRGLST